MADEDEGPASDAPTIVTPADRGGKTIVVALSAERPLDGVSLKELEDEAPLAPLRTGPEKYQVLKPIGEGGMGKVFAVQDRDLRRPVALKMIRAGGDRQKEQRFLEEAQVMGQLQHPNILHVYELGLTESKKLYYTMPLVRGRSLKDILDGLREGDPKLVRTYSITRLIQVFLQVAQAVSYAHARGVLHRDLKPANIMLGEHGEVQVLDWGLAKVVSGGQVNTDLEASITLPGHIVGTPAYMSPEQAQGEPEDARTDLYALGIILYEMLTLEVPFAGTSVSVLAALLRDTPVSPRSKAPTRPIPLELERSTLKALEKKPADRHGSVDELIAEAQRWLESESDRTRRRERADDKAREGRARLEQFRQLKREITSLEERAAAAAAQFQSWQPVDEKLALFAAEDEVVRARRRMVKAASDVVTTLSQALGFDGEHAEARSLLAAYYWDRFQDAEARHSEEDREFFAELVAAYHDGAYARELQGDGSLELDSNPPGAEVWLHPMIEQRLELVPGERRWLGTTPLAPLELPMGSYLVVLTRDGFREVRYPVLITRNRAWRATVNLYTDDEIGAGFVHVPAGPFIQGGDPECRGSVLPRAEPELEDYFISRHPVTIGEYLEYINTIARTDGLEAARSRAPRRAPQGPTYLLECADGSLALPDRDEDGDRWDPCYPVFGISWLDAADYCRWLSARAGRTCELPSDAQWEKAARGVDGRWFPWGWRFDPSLCNMVESRPEQRGPGVVEDFPADVSIYGVRGMAGNMRDWTATEAMGNGRRLGRVLRGGAWSFGRIFARSALRLALDEALIDSSLGFRVASRPPARPPQ